MTLIDVSWDLGVLCDAGVETTQTMLHFHSRLPRMS